MYKLDKVYKTDKSTYLSKLFSKMFEWLSLLSDILNALKKKNLFKSNEETIHLLL